MHLTIFSMAGPQNAEFSSLFTQNAPTNVSPNARVVMLNIRCRQSVTLDGPAT